MNMPNFHAEASLSSLQRPYWQNDVAENHGRASEVVPQIARVSCGNQFLDTACQPFASAGELGCWWLWWNRSHQIGCIHGHMTAAALFCVGCTISLT